VAADSLPDIVYVVRQGEQNVPLRYSLRSLGNLPHRRVIVAGSCPSWVKNVTRVPVHRGSGKFDNIERNLRAALDLPDLADEVVYMNDDFFIMEPIDRVPLVHGGPCSTWKPADELRRRFRKTIQVLGGGDPNRYDGTHCPFPLVTEQARWWISRMPEGLLWRTWYGNVAGLGGERTHDVKSRDGKPIPGPLLSTSAKAITTLKHYLEETLPKESPYV
jgi:hypothetical protein